MLSYLPHHFLFLLVTSITTALPMTVARADFDSGSFKVGVVQADTLQRFDNMYPHHVDRYSGVVSASVEEHLRYGFAYGFEVLAWNNEFTTPLGNPGDASTQMFHFIGKKYFKVNDRYHPYVGIGGGGILSKYSYCNGATCYQDSTNTLSGQIMLGLDVRFEKLSLVVEIKPLGLETMNYHFNPGWGAIFLGIGGRGW